MNKKVEKIILISRDTKAGVGSTVKNIVWELEKRPSIKKIAVIVPEAFPVFSNKVEFVIVSIGIGKYFFTKEVFFVINAQKALLNLLKREHFDVIHAHTNFFWSLPKKLPMVSTFQGTHKALISMPFPVVSTMHSMHKGVLSSIKLPDLMYKIGKYLHIPFIFLDKKRVNRSKIVTCVSEPTKEEIRRDYERASETLQFIPNGANTNQYYPENINKVQFWKQKYNINTEGKKVGVVLTRLEEGKGVNYLASLVQEIPNFVLIIAGEGPEKEHLHKYPNVHCVGFIIEEKDKREYLNAGDVFILPSYYENFPLSVVEAMACGLPVISHRVGMLHYILQNRDEVLVETANKAQFIEKLRSLLKNEKLMKELSEINLNFARTQLSWSKIIDKYITLYEKAINTP